MNKYNILYYFEYSSLFLEKFSSKNFFFISSKELLFSFKKFIRLLFFLKNKKFTLQLIVNNSYFLDFFNQIKKKFILRYIKIQFRNVFKFNKKSTIFFLDLSKDQFKILNKYYLKKNFLISYFNSTDSFYKEFLYNFMISITSVKRLIFLCAILNTIFLYEHK